MLNYEVEEAIDVLLKGTALHGYGEEALMDARGGQRSGGESETEGKELEQLAGGRLPNAEAPLFCHEHTPSGWEESAPRSLPRQADGARRLSADVLLLRTVCRARSAAFLEFALTLALRHLAPPPNASRQSLCWL